MGAWIWGPRAKKFHARVASAEPGGNIELRLGSAEGKLIGTYMSSTTMHLSPGLPIMKSKDLVNWQSWAALGRELRMSDTLPHFMGYRFGLFNYATQSPGGYADFDWFHVNAKIAPLIQPQAQ